LAQALAAPAVAAAAELGALLGQHTAMAATSLPLAAQRVRTRACRAAHTHTRAGVWCPSRTAAGSLLVFVRGAAVSISPMKSVRTAVLFGT
jgi:hypothetical protein